MQKSKGGVQALVGSSIAVFFPGSLSMGFLGVLSNQWQEMFHVGRGAISNSMFFVVVAIGISMPFVGRWQERFGVRRVMTVGAIICALDVLIIAFASHLWELYLFAFINGLSFSLIYIPAITTVQQWFPSRRGLVSGIVNLSFGGSAAVMSPVFALMLTSMGYVPMNIVLAVATLIIATAAAQITKSPVQTPLLDSKSETDVSFSTRTGNSITVSQSIRTKNFWLLWVIAILQGSAGISMVTLSVVFGLSRGFALESAVVLLMAFSLGNGLGRFLMGYLSDILGPKLTMSFSFLAAAAAYFCLPHITLLSVMALAAGFVGTAFGTLMTVSPPLTIDCFGIDHFGAIYGLVLTGYSFFGGIVGPALSGYLLDVTNTNFNIVFSYLGVFCLIAGSMIWFVVPPKRQTGA
jgi:MFS transporter, OFA family, oxalate/formate antiporter